MKTLQYQLSNGSWVDCEERTEDFLILCEKNNGVNRKGRICSAFKAERLLTREEVIAALESGKELRNDKDDWYSVCRMIDKDAMEKAQQARDNKYDEYMKNKKMLTCKSCGQSGYAGDHPFSTAPQTGLCDDCL